ncbi:MAG: thiopeptide-type bacteriocin biosynthesis protein [Muribaculaceae bacterium]|nr:thiopeptide-type bacteriocin biosynthesis protein [Muribaculaceae bacterium]
MTNRKRHIERDLHPGDRWLFFKIYGGIVMCDRLLVSTIFPLVERLKKRRMISKWFFIRYGDPEFHLRVRVELTDIKFLTDVVKAFNQKLGALCRERRLHKIVIDTYERELERYEGECMEASEAIFHLDSVCICEVLKSLMSASRDYERWKLSFQLIDTMMNVFNYTLEEKSSLMSQLKDGYQREFGFDEHNVKILATHYRNLKEKMQSLIQGDYDVNNCQKIVSDYRRNLHQIISKNPLRKFNVSSLMHMSMNRLFASGNRLNELMIYYSLDRFYQSELVRNNHK